MIDVAFAVPGNLDAPTGGYAYARRLLALLPRHGARVRHLALPRSFPHPSPADLAETARLLSTVPEGTVLLFDGLAYGVLPAELIRAAAGRGPVVALVHHPLGFETGLGPAQRETLLAAERRALALARAVVVTSPFTRRLLASRFGVTEGRITVAEPGTEPAARARGTGSPVALLAVGAVSPRKNYPILVEALAAPSIVPQGAPTRRGKDGASSTTPEQKSVARSTDACSEGPAWKLTVAGALDRSPDAVAALRSAIRQAGLGGSVSLAGSVPQPELDALYAAADVFVSPSRFEGYGMALAEALARGIPVVASSGGAGGETVPDGAGLKVPPDDPGALRTALQRMLRDPDLRRALGNAAWDAGRRLPRWNDTAGKVAGALRAAASAAAAVSPG